MAAGVCACHPSEGVELPPIAWEGEYLTFGASDHAGEYCAGSPAYLDAYVEGLVESLDQTPPPGKVRFSFVAEDEVPDHEDGVLGRSTEAGIISGLPVLEHELVHAVVRSDGLTHRLLEEGLAEYFGGDGDFSFREDTGRSLDEALAELDAGGRLLGEDYGVAGRFVAYIDNTFGREALLELDQSLERSSSTADLESAFVAVTEVSLDDARAEFAALEACPQGVYRDPIAACVGAEPLAWCDGAEAADHTSDLTCSSPDALGVRDDEIWSYHVLNIPAPGTYGLHFSPNLESDPGYAELKQCAGGCDSFRFQGFIPSGLTPASWFEISEPGDYILKLAVPRTSERTVDFQILGVECM